MARMPTFEEIREDFEREWQHLRHHETSAAPAAAAVTITATQENTMSRIAAAKEAADRASAALAGLIHNPLAEAIAETSAGASLDPERVRMVLGIISVIERSGNASTGLLGALSGQQAPAEPSAPQG